MKRLGPLLAAAVLLLTAYNTWQIRRLALVVDRRRAEASAAGRLEQALVHTRRARSLLRQRDAGQASAELDNAIRDVSAAAARSRQGGRSLVMSVRQGFNRATQRLRKALKHDRKARRA